MTLEKQGSCLEVLPPEWVTLILLRGIFIPRDSAVFQYSVSLLIFLRTKMSDFVIHCSCFFYHIVILFSLFCNLVIHWFNQSKFSSLLEIKLICRINLSNGSWLLLATYRSSPLILQFSPFQIQGLFSRHTQ